MSNSLIPSQTVLTLRRTDTLISLTNKPLANTGAKGISEMSDDELWEWWLGLSDEWKFLLIRRGLKLKLWHNKDWKFNRAYHYQTEFDWLNRELVFGCLKALRKLVKINLGNGKNQDLSVLTNLTQLTRLNLGNNQIQDISILINLTQLTKLDLNCNQIQNLSVLANLTKLTTLYLSFNQIQDTTPLANLSQLIELGLGNNQIQDISSLAHLTQLRFLNLNCNPIKSQDIKWLQQQLPNCRIYF